MKDEASVLLESVSLRRTQPRLLILEVLLKSDAPLTQDQISDIIGPETPNKTTIYRTLTHLIEMGLVHEAFVDNRSRHYELSHHCGKHSCHLHFTCKRCEQTECLTHIHLPLVELPNGYQIERQQIRIEGICPECVE